MEKGVRSVTSEFSQTLDGGFLEKSIGMLWINLQMRVCVCVCVCVCKLVVADVCGCSTLPISIESSHPIPCVDAPLHHVTLCLKVLEFRCCAVHRF